MKRALLVGIDSYQEFSPLSGCVNDVSALAPLLRRNHDDSLNFECQTRVSIPEEVSRDSLLAALDALLCTPADVALFYFAGHGARIAPDVALVTYDGTTATPGIAMSEVLAKVADSPVKEVVIMLDCCFSGSAGSIPQLGVTAAALREGVSILTASREEESAAETDAGRGAFSTFLEGGLDGGAADTRGKVTIAGLYSYLEEAFGAWDQRPLFKAHISRLIPLRIAEPPISEEVLRKLTDWFPEPHFEFPLDPSFEPDEEPKNPENEEIFDALQKCRAARLLVPIDEDHMYYAALHSTACKLTPLGRLYWHQAAADRL